MTQEERIEELEEQLDKLSQAVYMVTRYHNLDEISPILYSVEIPVSFLKHLHRLCQSIGLTEIVRMSGGMGLYDLPPKGETNEPKSD